MSEPWSPYTKRIIIIIALIVCALVLWRFRDILPPLIVAVLVAYILIPVVDFVMRRLQLGRTPATALVYLLLIAALLIIPAVIIPVIIVQVRGLNVDFQQIYDLAQPWLYRTITLGDWSFDTQTLIQEMSGQLRSVLSPLASSTFSLVINVASGLLQGFFVLIISFYIVRDAPNINEFIDKLPPLSTRGDARQLRQEISNVWNDFLRGQLILCMVIGIVVTIATSIVGLRYALVIGLVAGALEFIPNLGPVIATIPAVVVALLNGSSWLPVSNIWFAVLIIALYIVIQQVENNYLVPRILGEQLDLHPLAVLIAVLAGASLAGVLGIFLAAPVLATVRVLASYAYSKLQDQDPFPPQPPTPDSPSIWQRLRQLMAQRSIRSLPQPGNKIAADTSTLHAPHHEQNNN